MKQELHLTMNGVVSESMKAKGADYRVIYGVAYPQLKTMAKEYPKEASFARLLWNSNIREMMILATMLWPPDSFPEKTADSCFLFIVIIAESVADITDGFLV